MAKFMAKVKRGRKNRFCAAERNVKSLAMKKTN